MTREDILRKSLEMASHNLHCCSANYLMNTPKEGMEQAHKEAAAEVELIKAWLKEFNPCHNPDKCTAKKSDMNTQKVSKHGVVVDGKYVMHHSMLPYLGMTVIVKGASVWYGDTHLHTF